MSMLGHRSRAATRLIAFGWNHRLDSRILRVLVCVLGFSLMGGNVAKTDAAAVANVETGEPNFTVRTWTTKQGLPENKVTALLQSQDGYLWVGTPDGLACFDGVRFRRYGVADGLPHAGITVLQEDRRGVLWVGTERGLARCETGQHASPSFKRTLAGVFVTGLAEDAEGRLWVGTDKGLYQWTEGQMTRAGENIGLPPQAIQKLYADRSGVIWVWGSAAKLFQIITSGKAVEVPVNFPLPGAKTIHSLLEDRAGRLWISTGNGYMLCREQGRWKKFNQYQGVPFFFVSSLAETRDGTLWAGSYGKGLVYLNDDRFLPAIKEQAPADENILSLCSDSEGGLWVGTASRGLSCLRPKQIATWADNAGLSNSVVAAMVEMPDGRLLAATEGGLYRQNESGFERWFTHTKADIYPRARSVLATHDGNIWWASDRNLFNLKTVQQPVFTNQTLAPQTKSNLTVTCLLEDRQQHLWAGTYNGLWRQQSDTFEMVDDLPVTDRVQALVLAPDGSMCAGTDKSGVYLLAPDGLRHYTTQQGLGSDSIRALYYDPAGVLWIGTRNGGLSRLKDNGISTYATRDGLASDTISQILEDDAGDLWLGSNRGISRISKQEFDDLAVGRITSLHPLNLNEEDGMLVEECSGGTNPTALKSRAGLLYFSTLKGIVVVDPKRYRSVNAPPSVVIEEILVNGRNLPANAARSGGISAVSEKPEPAEIILPPGQNNLDFHYTGLHSSTPESIGFRYQLAGLDREWVDAGTRRFANYAQIPPGHYRFRVMAANREGTWMESGAGLRLFLRPHFYQTWWFQAGLLGVAAFGLTMLVRAIVKRRLQHRLQRLELEQSLENERRRIARDLHDELGARLTSIAHLGELAMRENPSLGDMKLQISFITSRVQQLMGAMNEVVWTINPKNDSLPNIAAFLSDYTERFLAPTGISWRLEGDLNYPNLPVSAQVRHNLLLAAKETLSNAVRHASATMIRMHIHVENGWLHVMISDNGRGFERATPRPGGNGLANLKSRMELIKGRAEIASQPGLGTMVTLTVPLPANPEPKTNPVI